jgi:hypothetical protein
MAAKDHLQGMITRSGASRGERVRQELEPGWVEIDDRSPEVMLSVTRALAEHIPYSSTSGATGNWSSFFAQDPGEFEASGSAPAQLALFAAFAEIYQAPRALLNAIADRHLDFQYRVVLGLEKRPAKPEHVHVVLTLKKGIASVEITPEHRFSAGKDANGVERIYAPIASTVIHAARVASLRSIYRDDRERGRVRHAPIADSSDGLGGALDPVEPAWPGFGHVGLPIADLGFAVASPLLRLAGGKRTIHVSLELEGAGSLEGKNLAGAFTASLTGKKGWLGATPTSSWADGTLTASFVLSTVDDAIVDYDARVHGFAYATRAPLLRMIFVGTADLGYLDFEPITVTAVRIRVEVDELLPDSLENDHGRLPPGKTFMPFGAEPRVGSQLRIRSLEAMAKPLSELKLNFDWQDLPRDFREVYAFHERDAIDGQWFTVMVDFTDRGGWSHHASSSLFARDQGSESYFLAFTKPSNADSDGVPIASPSSLTRSPPIQPVITLELEKSFMHAEYRRALIQASRAKRRKLPLEPYTPVLQGLSLSYAASSGLVDLSSGSIEFFHDDCFGQRREHGRVSLLPTHERGGQLLIGLAGTRPGESISLLVQVAEGSADPELPRFPIRWSVLSDNHWLPLHEGENTFDSTNGMTSSGIVTVVLPTDVSTANTLMPADLLWLRATVENVDAVCSLLSVQANAVALRFVDRGNAPADLDGALQAGSIQKLVTPIAGVKTSSQPYASFGGAPAEDDITFRTRVAERLRHKDRAITVWDYERIVLEAFPGIHRVKCIPHAKPGSWSAPGHVTLVVIPDLRNHNARDPLQPRVDADTIARITEYVEQRAGLDLHVWVRNPVYQRVQLAFEVQLHAGHEFDHYRAELENALIRVLSPWAFDPQRSLEFGGRIHRSQLLHFVERLNYVDYLTNFRMYTLDASGRSGDLIEARPISPDAVLVSAAGHQIMAASRNSSGAIV